MIQVFVEALDRCFENVCELDLIFHSDKVLYILDEIVMGGLVLETNLPEIISAIEEQSKLERCAPSFLPILLLSLHRDGCAHVRCREDNPFSQISKAIENIRR